MMLQKKIFIFMRIFLFMISGFLLTVVLSAEKKITIELDEVNALPCVVVEVVRILVA